MLEDADDDLSDICPSSPSTYFTKCLKVRTASSIGMTRSTSNSFSAVFSIKILVLIVLFSSMVTFVVFGKVTFQNRVI